MQNLQNIKTKLEQKKARLQMEEVKMKLKEQKMRTRFLIDLGKLVIKSELDSIPTDTLYGALLSLKNQINEADAKTLDGWTKAGSSKMQKENKEAETIILTLENNETPTKELTASLRKLGLKWNFARKEYYGRVLDSDSLNKIIKNYPHKIDMI